ncbi:hypothetical protein DFAR_3460007 [Desulfarculales bacterium]
MASSWDPFTPWAGITGAAAGPWTRTPPRLWSACAGNCPLSTGVAPGPAQTGATRSSLPAPTTLEKLSREQSLDMLEILENRYGLGATIVAAQMSVDQWHETISKSTLTDAILDRLIHNAYKINLQKEKSMRKTLASLTGDKTPVAYNIDTSGTVPRPPGPYHGGHAFAAEGVDPTDFGLDICSLSY